MRMGRVASATEPPNYVPVSNHLPKVQVKMMGMETNLEVIWNIVVFASRLSSKDIVVIEGLILRLV